jgi:maltooligosyltrehalose trehalohydrolase
VSQFPSIATPEVQARLPDPDDRDTFERCKLDFTERVSHGGVYAMHRDLLRLRREQAALRRAQARHFDGAVLAPEAFVLRFFGEDGDDRLLVINLGRDLRLDPSPEPLLAPLDGHGWKVLWSSEDPAYGGMGTPPPETEEGWRIPGQSALLLAPEAA